MYDDDESPGPSSTLLDDVVERNSMIVTMAMVVEFRIDIE